MFKIFEISNEYEDRADRSKDFVQLLNKNFNGRICTGGLLSSRLTDVAGSSSYIKENFVTYANEAKIELLNVSQETLETYGAVSEQCAKEMAEGLYKKTGCDVAISTTGIAVPTTPEAGRPVGLMYVAIKNNAHLQLKR